MDEKQAQLVPAFSGDNNTMPYDISPAVNVENYTQSNNSGGLYDKYDDILTSGSPAANSEKGCTDQKSGGKCEEL